jgi:hypothetical protein
VLARGHCEPVTLGMRGLRDFLALGGFPPGGRVLEFGFQEVRIESRDLNPNDS